MASNNDQRSDGLSPELDELSSTLMGDAFDLLAEEGGMDVLLVVQDAAQNVASYVFGEDGPEECLNGAREKVMSLAREHGDAEFGLADPVRYVIAYEAAIEGDAGAFEDALLIEFGEKGYKSFSAYSLVEGKGEGDGFGWTDPAPAGECEPLL